MRWTRVLRVFLGFLLAPIPVLLLFWSAALLFLGAFGPHENPNEILLLVPVWTYGLTVLIGLPIHILLQRKVWRGVGHYLIAGVAISAVLACFGALLAGDLLGVLIGFFSGFVFNVLLITFTVALFWLIAVWQPRWPGKAIGSARAVLLRRAQSGG